MPPGLPLKEYIRSKVTCSGRAWSDAIARLAPLQDDGLVEVDGRGLHATSRGRLLLRIIAMCFDRYLAPAADATATPRYSRTV